MPARKFFIGKESLPDAEDAPRQQDLIYPAANLMTHALIIGASGSGKTVQCKNFIEEAILNRVPVIAIDPKGDISALGLVPEKLDLSHVEPLVAHEAEDVEMDPTELAEDVVETYGRQLEQSYGSVEAYEQNLEKLARTLRVLIIQPSGRGGVELDSLPQFEADDATSPEMVDLKIGILLEKAGYANLKSTDQKVMFLGHLLQHYWTKEKMARVKLPDLIRGVLDPPIDNVGMMPVEDFISKKVRQTMASNLNSVMLKAKPGVPLDIGKLLAYAKQSLRATEAPDDPPDLSNVVPMVTFDLRGLVEEKDRQNLVAQVLSAVHRWIWKKGGTSRLRAILYFDELYGFIPPVRQTPCKDILLLLLKQARSFGLGLVMATQNPGDLDYRGLGNISTWFVGRLTSKTDVKKVSSALTSVLEAAGKSRKEIRAIISRIQGLKPGEFVFYNSKMGVKLTRSRWLLSYHKGPLVPAEMELVTVVPPVDAEGDEDEDEAAGGASDLDDGEEETSVELDDALQAELDARAAEETADARADLVSAPPKVKGYLERYLPVKIKPSRAPDGKLRRILEERLGVTKHLYDAGLTLEIADIIAYYAPVLVYPVEIHVSDAIDFEDHTIKLNVDHAFTRAVDLRHGEIDWEAEVVEDIHPASLPAQELQLSPEAAVPLYLDLKEAVTPKKIEDNLRWSLSKNAIPDADVLLKRAIATAKDAEIRARHKSERTKADKLEKKLAKIGADVSVAQVKKNELEERLESLQKELKLRQEAERATSQIKISINSTKKRIKTAESKITTLNIKFAEVNKEFADLKETMAELEGVYGRLADQVGQSAVFEPFYVPDRKQIKIPEKLVYLVPRARVVLEATCEEKANAFVVDINLYNGNGHIPCAACADDPKTIKQAPLGITPPRVLCPSCLQVYCLDHTIECAKCGGQVLTCTTCSAGFQCAVCGQNFCYRHVFKCAGCGRVICDDDLYECQGCGNYVCRKCARVVTQIKGTQVRKCRKCP